MQLFEAAERGFHTLLWHAVKTESSLVFLSLEACLEGSLLEGVMTYSPI